MCLIEFVLFKQTTAYEMRISDWSSDVCSSDLVTHSVEVSAMRFSRDWIARGLDAAVAHPEGLHGPRITLPTDSMPSVGLRAERLETGNTYRRNRSSANRIYSVVSGCGPSRVAGETVCCGRGATFSFTSRPGVEHHTE